MLLFFSILALIVLFSLIILFSEFNINVINFEFTNIKEIICNPNKIKLEILLFGKIKWLSYSFKNIKISKKININNFKNYYKKIKDRSNGLTKKERVKQNLYIENFMLKLIKYSKIKKFNIEIIIDTENPELLAYITTVIATIIPNALREHISYYKKERFSFEIIPLFNNTNSIYIKLNCIFSIKIVHIINMLKLEKRRGKNERTSNRRFNANSNGKHKEYDRC